MVLCNSEDDPEREQAYPRVLLEKRVDGLIVGSTGENNTFAKQLRQLRVPLMIIDRPIPGVDANLVQVDHEQGGYLATKHLLELPPSADDARTVRIHQRIYSPDLTWGFSAGSQDAPCG